MTDQPSRPPVLADEPADPSTGPVDPAPAPSPPQRTRFAEPAGSTSAAAAMPTPTATPTPTPTPTPALPTTPTPRLEPPVPAEPAPIGLVKGPEPAPSAVPPATAAPAEEPDAVPAVPAVGVATGGRGLVLVLGGVVLVLAVLTAFLGYQAYATRGQSTVETSRRDAVGAARNAARLVFSYDYRHLTKDFAAGRATTTGVFRGEYDKTTAKLVNDVAPRYKAVVVADVSDAAVTSASASQVVALVFLNQSSSSTLAAQPKITQSRLELTMVHRDGHWLVGRIKAL